MALLEKDRNRIYTEFRQILGEEATQAMLSQFPARDVDEPATKGDLALLRAELQVELATMRDHLTGRMLTLLSAQTAVIGTLLVAFR